MRSFFIDEIVSNIGSKIKTLRVQKGLSLKKLADVARISHTAIYKIERNEMTPTITVLMKIADALGKKVSHFIDEDGEAGDLEFIKNLEYSQDGTRMCVLSKDRSIEIEFLAFKLREGKLFAAIFHLKPGTSSGGKPIVHPGEEFAYCFKGSLECIVEETKFTLKAGDSLRIFSTLPHSWQVVGKHPAKVLWVVTPPTQVSTEIWQDALREFDIDMRKLPKTFRL